LFYIFDENSAEKNLYMDLEKLSRKLLPYKRKFKLITGLLWKSREWK